jgi:hypothetical protein
LTSCDACMQGPKKSAWRSCKKGVQSVDWASDRAPLAHAWPLATELYRHPIDVCAPLPQPRQRPRELVLGAKAFQASHISSWIAFIACIRATTPHPQYTMRCIVLAVLCVQAATTHARPVSGGQRGGRASHVGGLNSSSDVFNVVDYGAVGDDRWVLEPIQLVCTHKVTPTGTATATCCTTHPTHLSPLNYWCSWHTSSSA